MTYDDKRRRLPDVTEEAAPRPYPTLDDFYERIIRPKAERGDPVAKKMFEFREVLKTYPECVTPEIIRKLAEDLLL